MSGGRVIGYMLRRCFFLFVCDTKPDFALLMQLRSDHCVSERDSTTLCSSLLYFGSLSYIVHVYAAVFLVTVW